MCQGSGLSEKQIEACDHFIYIPHYGGGTASLNVACAASIVPSTPGDRLNVAAVYLA